MQFHKINSFVNFIKDFNNKTIYVFDIDETVLKFKSINHDFQKNRFNDFYEKTKDYEKSESMTYDIWKTIIKDETPILTDNSFLELFFHIIYQQLILFLYFTYFLFLEIYETSF